MGRHSKYPDGAGIYKLTCVDTGKVYIGKAVNLRQRLALHKNTSKKSKGRYYFQHAIIKHGWESFTVEILELFDNFDKTKDNEYLLEREKYYIELFESTNLEKGYNICRYSTDRTGIPMSGESKSKMRKPKSAEHKENIRQSKLGTTLTEETRLKIGQSNIGRIFSEESKEKLRQANLGKKLSEETKEKLRQSKLGKTPSDETREKLRQSKLGKPNLNMLGKTHSPETKEKCRQVNLGKKLSEETKEKMRQAKLRKNINSTYEQSNSDSEKES